MRTIDELAADELRKGFLKLRRTVQERMSIRDQQDMTPRSADQPQVISAAIEYFFGRGELSQVVDQTNPLSQLTHERRLSALGPGGLNRKRAGFDVRDVHISHYGRICPIETPEGTNIGLISHLSIYATVDDYGFLVTPYRKVDKKKLTDEVKHAARRRGVAGCTWPRPTRRSTARQDHRRPRHRRGSAATSSWSTADQVQYVDVSPKQMVGVSAGPDPVPGARRRQPGADGLEHAAPGGAAADHRAADRRHRAWRRPVAQNSGMVVRAERDGTVTYVDAERIRVDEREYLLRKFVGLNEHTCQNQKPIVKVGDKVKKGQVHRRRGGDAATASWRWAATCWSRSCPGRATTSRTRSSSASGWWRTTPTRRSTSRISRSRSARRSWARRSSPATSPTSRPRRWPTSTSSASSASARSCSRATSWSARCRRSRKSELTPEEKLLHAIFGRAGEDVKNDSLEVPSGVEGIVIDTQRFSRRASMSEEEKKAFDKEQKEIENRANKAIADQFRALIAELAARAGQARR